LTLIRSTSLSPVNKIVGITLISWHIEFLRPYNERQYFACRLPSLLAYECMEGKHQRTLRVHFLIHWRHQSPRLRTMLNQTFRWMEHSANSFLKDHSFICLRKPQEPTYRFILSSMPPLSLVLLFIMCSIYQNESHHLMFDSLRAKKRILNF
jgi:hypothetical protein